MRDSIRLGKISGIPIGMHWSIVLIAALFTFTLAGTILPGAVAGAPAVGYWAVALLTTTAFLASIVAHELGHSLVAKNNGVGIAGITLFALGGVARLESEPEDPGVAGRIAIAGPAVSVAIGLGSLAAALAAGALGFPALLTAGITWLGIVNLVMAVFNMIPALPLDGGRVLQSVLWKRDGNRHQATIRAAKLGRYIGWGLVALGLWQFLSGGAGLWTALIGWFIVTSARAEGFRARMQLEQERLGPFGRFWPFGPGSQPPTQPPFGPGSQPPTQPPYQQGPPPPYGPGSPPPPGPRPQPPFGFGSPSGHRPGSFPPPAPGVIDVDGQRVN